METNTPLIPNQPTNEQLTLSVADHVHPRFRLDRQARLRGLAHVAEIRRLLEHRRQQPHDQRAA